MINFLLMRVCVWTGILLSEIITGWRYIPKSVLPMWCLIMIFGPLPGGIRCVYEQRSVNQGRHPELLMQSEPGAPLPEKMASRALRPTKLEILILVRNEVRRLKRVSQPVFWAGE